MRTFDEVYDAYAVMLYKIAFVYFGNPYDSEDAVQEVFAKYLKKAPPFKDETHERAWLIRVTQRQCLDMLKSPSRRSTELSEETLFADEEDRELKTEVFRLLNTLPPKNKTVVVLYYYYGYSVREIAQMLKLSQSAVKMRLKRSREQLKTEWEDANNETG